MQYRMKVIFIRHGMTKGNEQKRYIGRTDEPLSEEGRKALRAFAASNLYPPVKTVVVSPMIRCRQTADLIYPGQSPLIVDDFRECDFGMFEGKNYHDLCHDKTYRQFLDSQGTLPFPGGEDTGLFKERCVRAFSDVMMNIDDKGAPVAFIVHGGTIMSIMERFAKPAGTYYDFQVANGAGYAANYAEGRLEDLKTFA